MEIYSYANSKVAPPSQMKQNGLYSQHKIYDWFERLIHISLASHFWDIGKQCRPRERESDQDLHGLFTGNSIKNEIKIKKKCTKNP